MKKGIKIQLFFIFKNSIYFFDIFFFFPFNLLI